jgi:hypothetical protein
MKQKLLVGLIEVFGEDDGISYLEITNLAPPPHKRVRTFDQEIANYEHLQVQSAEVKDILKKALTDAGFKFKSK